MEETDALDVLEEVLESLVDAIAALGELPASYKTRMIFIVESQVGAAHDLVQSLIDEEVND